MPRINVSPARIHKSNESVGSVARRDDWQQSQPRLIHINTSHKLSMKIGRLTDVLLTSLEALVPGYSFEGWTRLAEL